jgi:hypothetical protein
MRAIFVFSMTILLLFLPSCRSGEKTIKEVTQSQEVVTAETTAMSDSYSLRSIWTSDSLDVALTDVRIIFQDTPPDSSACYPIRASPKVISIGSVRKVRKIENLTSDTTRIYDFAATALDSVKNVSTNTSSETIVRSESKSIWILLLLAAIMTLAVYFRDKLFGDDDDN